MSRPSKEQIEQTKIVQLVRNLPPQRPEPPAELSEEEAQEWIEIVAVMPAEWFTRETHPMLVQLCRAIVASRFAAIEMCKLRASKKVNALQIGRLSRLQDLYTRSISSLSTKMRLSQQSRYNYSQAHAVAKNATPKKLWEVAK
jgi:hypothetical protein